jgi:hypothetical protein
MLLAYAGFILNLNYPENALMLLNVPVEGHLPPYKKEDEDKSGKANRKTCQIDQGICPLP